MTDESTKPRGTVSLDADVMELLLDEQFRLRKLEGKRVSYSEIMRRALAAPHSNTKKPAKSK